MTPAAADLLLHLTGRRADAPEPGREHVVVEAGSTDADLLRELAERGLVVDHGFRAVFCGHVWQATPAGHLAAVAEAEARAALVPRRTRARRARYLDWLDLSDLYPHITFGDYLRGVRP